MKLFHNGAIHTMDPANPSPEAILVGDDGRIRALGSRDEFDTRGIEHIDLEIYEGKVHDLIMFIVSEEFGLSNVRMILTDEDGKVIESGKAFVCMDQPDLWHCFTTASVSSGTSVTVQAIAIDRLFGIGTWSETKIIP